MHYLLYTSDRQHGGHYTLGIFNTEEEAWQHYHDTHQEENDRYWRRPHIECWINDTKIEDK